jgi:sterol O-acyltransferase
MFLFTLSTYIRSLETHGYVLNLAFATMFSKDAITLALSDAVLVGCTAICVPFATALSKGWIRYCWTGVILQHLLQTAILFGAVTWTFNRHVHEIGSCACLFNFRLCRQWPWVQSGFLTLHSMVNIPFDVEGMR